MTAIGLCMQQVVTPIAVKQFPTSSAMAANSQTERSLCQLTQSSSSLRDDSEIQLQTYPRNRHNPSQVWRTSSHSHVWLCRGTARRQAQAEHKADVLAEENASLILELDARPTAKQYKSLRRQMDILERRLNESKAEAQGYA